MKRIVWALAVCWVLGSQSAGAQTLWREIPLADNEGYFYYLELRSSGRGQGIFQRLSLVKKDKETCDSVERIVVDTPSYVDKGTPGADEYLRQEDATYLSPLNWNSYFVVEDGIVFAAHSYREQLLSADSLALQAPRIGPEARVVGSYMSPHTQARPKDKLYLVVQSGDAGSIISSEFIVALSHRAVVLALAAAERHRAEENELEKKD